MGKFNGFTIHDEKGKSYVLLVQRSIYPDLPVDSKPNEEEGTIVEEEDFQLFIETLNKQKQPQQNPVEEKLEPAEETKATDAKETEEDQGEKEAPEQKASEDAKQEEKQEVVKQPTPKSKLGHSRFLRATANCTTCTGYHRERAV